jgi:hypothetical protein
MGFRTSRFWFPAIPLSCHPNYRALTFALAGLSPAEHTSLTWLQLPDGRILRVRLATMTVPVRPSPTRRGLSAHSRSPRRERFTAQPGAKGLPRSSTAACRPNYAGAESGMGDTSTTRHDREPLRTFEVLPLKGHIRRHPSVQPALPAEPLRPS